MSFPPKFVTILCVVQFFAIAAGYLVTCASLKIWDSIPAGGPSMQIPGFVHLVRSSGLWLVLLPTAWCLIAALQGSVIRGTASITLPHFLFGLVFTAAVVLGFALSAIYAMHAAYGVPGTTPFHR